MAPFRTPDGLELFYELIGEGEPVVLLNGIMMTTQSWALQTAFLARSYRCLLHDFRGQLRSPDLGVPFTMATHVDDLRRLLDHLDIESAHLVGTSYGGEVAMMFAVAQPERIGSLTVIASTSRVEPSMIAKVKAGREAALHDRDRLYDVAAAEFFYPEFLAANPQLVEAGRTRLRALRDDFFTGYARLCDAFFGLEVTEQLSSIRCPTLIIAAEHDFLKPPSCSSLIAERIPNARLVVVPAAGHAVVVERPDAVNELLGVFLASV